MPSAKRRRRLSMGNLRCNVRNGGAMASGLSLTLSMAWHCAQWTRTKVRPRCAAGDWARTGLLAIERNAPTAIVSLGSHPNDFRTILIRPGLSSSLSHQCQERRRVVAIFLPSRIGRILCELVLAPAFASTDRAYALKIAHDLRVGVRDSHPIELDLVHAPIQQNRGVRPFAGEDGEIGSADTDVAGDAFHLGRTATIKVRHRPPSAVPASPQMRKPTNKSVLFAYLNRARH